MHESHPNKLIKMAKDSEPGRRPGEDGPADHGGEHYHHRAGRDLSDGRPAIMDKFEYFHIMVRSSWGASIPYLGIMK